jgi:alpha-tubulin suppressor-like RCC1 family protein
MRNSLLVLLASVCLGPRVYSQSTPPIVVAAGEYQAFFYHTSDRILYAVGGAVETQGIGTNPTQTLGTPIKVQLPAGVQMKSVSSPLHSAIGVDMNGNVWFWGANDAAMRGDGTIGGAVSYVPVQVATDATGQPFNNVSQVSCWWNEVLSSTGVASSGALVCKNDGTVWIWGNTIGGMCGNGQTGQINYKPVQVNIPGNPHIVKVLAGEICMALDNNGNVYTWGGNGRNMLLGNNATNYTTPQKVNLPKPAKDIAGADLFEYALATDGTLYGWGIYGAYLGIGTGPYLAANTFQPLPVDLTSDLNLPHPVSQILCNSVSTHVILTDSTLWGWGDNTEGNVGNGVQINWATYPTPYAWDWGAAEVLQNKPVQIAPLVHNFTAMFAGSSACFYMYAENATGQLYSWGRNKSLVLANGVDGATSDIEASYPDGWDQPTITAVNPFTLTKLYQSTCPYCMVNPGSSPCSEYKIPNGGAKPVSVPGANQTISLPTTTGVLNGTGSNDPNGVVVYYKWQQVSGPSANTVLDPTYAETRLSGLVAGTYVYSLTVTDNAWNTNTANVTVTVKATGNVAPTVTAGNDPTITLPTSSTTLAGTATGNNGATIKGLSWKQTSGPATATIASPASINTTVSGLTVAGTYVFSLTATDNNNLTATGTVSVVVNPAPTSTTGAAPTVSAGEGQAITLPTSSTTLKGTATGNGGATIKGLTWKQDSGPATATIASPASMSTTVTGLTVAGNYIFTLYATDNNDKSANGSMTVTVKSDPSASPSTPKVATAPVTTTEVAPTVNAGEGQAITLPTSSTTLKGSATGNDGATIKGLTWKQDSGPVSATIASPASISTVVTGLTAAGDYVFTLMATDNNGKTANGSITVTVNPGVETPPSVSAGADPTITLPTNSITLNGSASGTNGATITSVFWEFISGPAFVKFSNEWALTCTMSELVAGTYVFELSVTDNHGKTSTSLVDVIVKPVPVTTNTQSTAVNGGASIFGDSIDTRPLAIFPNPVHDLLNVRLNTVGTGKVLIVIYNQTGDRVQVVQVEKDNLALQTSVDVSRLAQGVYTLQVLSGNSVNSSRFIKL